MNYVLQDVQSLDGWRSIVVALLSCLVALVAVVYRDLSRRLHNLEKTDQAAKDDFVLRKEYERAHNDLLQHIDQRLTRIELAMDRRRKGE